MSAYYNEIDPFAAAWLRELIRAGLIAPGEVDERSIEQVAPEDLRGFTQCHFFAGIGVWSYALRGAGWPDDKRVWTGSCPCQPFSVSGKRARASDERHLWPIWFPLIRESRPECVLGEQVASDDGLAWLDLVSTDLEGQGYTIGAVDTCAASFGAPHIRQRLYFSADTERDGGRSDFKRRETQGRDANGRDSETGDGSNAQHNGHHRPEGLATVTDSDQSRERLFDRDSSLSDGSHSDGRYPSAEGLQRSGEHGLFAADRIAGNTEQQGLERLAGHEREWRGPGWLDPLTARSIAASGATRDFWSDCDWWHGRDGKFRPIGAGLFPLAHGASARVGRLRGYGNAIVAPQAQAFIEAYQAIKAAAGASC